MRQPWPVLNALKTPAGPGGSGQYNCVFSPGRLFASILLTFSPPVKLPAERQAAPALGTRISIIRTEPAESVSRSNQ